ncbi:rho GTPase-activating protein 15 [Takifugu rubripes]|uniref:rho GTPase-activating protein 15 n=1 Tax=Takifugu rubripes TaxID=31033 RepID=UPI0011451E54|nr:rho GTPase-activating protein 15-like [Takifugu rubripes]
MATRTTNLTVAPQGGAVQLRAKGPQSSGDRLSQSKSMVLQEADLPQKPMCRHRRNQSHHDVVRGGDGGAVLKAEPLTVTKISERGKKQKKNWTMVWSELTSDQLIFYKQQQPTATDQRCALDVLSLSGAAIEWTAEKSSRKNVFQITTNTGSEFLIQADSSSTAASWYDTIRKTIKAPMKDEWFPLQRSNSMETLSRHSSLPKHSTSPNIKHRNQVHRRSINVFSSKLKHTTSEVADKNSVKNRLKKFISRRPSMRTLQDKGLIKDQVFGCHLQTLCQREGTTVPKFVQVCLDAVEKRGLEVDGIYRVSGNLATIQKLRFIVDHEEHLDLDHSQWEDIHVVTGALKMFFRELPEPLFPFRFFPLFVDAIKMKDSKCKLQRMKKLIQELPKPNQDTMKVLFSHLLSVLKFSRRNLMSTQGFGIVFGPTLMWPELDAGNMAVNMVFQNQVVEFILTESQHIFDLDRK